MPRGRHGAGQDFGGRGLLAERDSCEGAKDLKKLKNITKGVTVYVVICGCQFKGQLLCNLKKQAFI
jgi:hypothetical protein